MLETAIEDAHPGNAPDRPTAALLNSRRALRAGGG